MLTFFPKVKNMNMHKERKEKKRNLSFRDIYVSGSMQEKYLNKMKMDLCPAYSLDYFTHRWRWMCRFHLVTPMENNIGCDWKRTYNYIFFIYMSVDIHHMKLYFFLPYIKN